MSPWRGELEGGDLVLFLDSVLDDSHHVVFRIVLPSDDKLKLSHIIGAPYTSQSRGHTSL